MSEKDTRRLNEFISDIRKDIDHVVSNKARHFFDASAAKSESGHDFSGQIGACLFMPIKTPFRSYFFPHTGFGNIVKEGCQPKNSGGCHLVNRLHGMLENGILVMAILPPANSLKELRNKVLEQ